ncbi:CinA family protein [Acholeplasma equifetale]|jgi:PncC family amidohydrolase|uniref:CinA family protein n=1 Tax=Acholeplasma equifetale TaxID=264634 RepID=UPI00068DF4CD|nr:nicotinamide-nucleotide amidohydrolase family protein [Acholeplasma equifetale]
MKNIVEILIEKKLTLSCAESITGGNLIGTLIKIPNASQVIKESFVVYSDEAKHEILNIPLEVIEKNGVVSREVARFMAKNLHEKTHADIAISTTGYASGNFPHHAYVGIYYQGEIFLYHKDFNENQSREQNIEELVQYIITLLPEIIV